MEEKPFIVMYHGAIGSGRGIEQLIQVVATIKDVYGVILGYGSENYIEQLHELAANLGVLNRIMFHEAVPQSELWKYIGAADVELILIQNVSPSYYLSLPNKFFESVQSLTPMISSNFPEMEKLINKYNIGVTCKPDDINAIVSCVNELKDNKMLLDSFVKNLATAKNELSWEKESQALYNAYGELMNWSDCVKAVKLLLSDYTGDSRDKREVAVMMQLGWRVTLAYPVSLYGCYEGDDCIDIKRRRITSEQNPFIRKILVVFNEINTIAQIRKIRADIISCHDLTALRYAWIAYIGKKRPKLVYDSHEFEIGRYTEGKRSKFSSKVIAMIERFLIKRVSLSVMVNESIALEVTKIYGLTKMPVVARNVPQNYLLDKHEIEKVRNNFENFFESSK